MAGFASVTNPFLYPDSYRFSASISVTGQVTLSTTFLDTLPRDNNLLIPFSFCLFAITTRSTFSCSIVSRIISLSCNLVNSNEGRPALKESRQLSYHEFTEI